MPPRIIPSSPNKAMILPNEILTSLFSLLPQTDLLSLALACKKFHQLVQPLLYHNITLHAHSEIEHRYPPATQYEPCRLLTRTLRASPPLVPLIRHLTLEARHPTLLTEHLFPLHEPRQDFSFPALTSLTLRHAQLHIPIFRDLLLLAPHLSVLDVNFECDAEAHDAYHTTFLDCTSLGGALLCRSDTLVRLKISVSFVTSVALEIENGGSYENLDGWGIRGSLGKSLKGMRVLQEVDVPCCVLLGWSSKGALGLGECLPEGLRELVVAHDLGFFVGYEWGSQGGEVGRLMEFLGEGEKATLRSLGVRFSGDYEDEERPSLDRELWGGLEERCREVGCRLVLEGREMA